MAKDPNTTERQQRLDALQSLVTSSQPSDDERQRARPRPHRSIGFLRQAPRRFRCQALIWGSVALFVMVVVAIIAASFKAPAKPFVKKNGPAIFSMQFPNGHVTCPTGMNWSPDGKTLAVVGYGVCSQQEGVEQGTHPIVSLYHAADGHEFATLPLEAALVRDVTHGAPIDGYVLSFGSLVWTADGQTLGLTFYLGPSGSDTSTSDTYNGVVTLRVTGAASATTVGRSDLPFNEFFDIYNLDTTVPPVVVRYDVVNHTAAILAPKPSLFYTSGIGGSLALVAPGSTSGGSVLPAGVSGSISYVCASHASPTAGGNTNYYWMSAGGAAWSPDDHYFYSTLGAYGRVTDAAPSASQAAEGSGQSCAPAGAPEKWLSVPLPAPGLHSALHLLDPVNVTDLVFATSADGSRVAFSPQGNAETIQTFVILDAATGAQVANLTTPQILKGAQITVNQSGDIFSNMSWAPDGHSLALLDPQDRIMVILGPANLR